MLEGESKRKTWRKVQVCDFVLGSSGHKDGSIPALKMPGILCTYVAAWNIQAALARPILHIFDLFARVREKAKVSGR